MSKIWALPVAAFSALAFRSCLAKELRQSLNR